MKGSYIDSIEYLRHGVVCGLYIELSPKYEPYLLGEYYCESVMVQWQTDPPRTDVVAVSEDNTQSDELICKSVTKWDTVCITNALTYTFKSLV